MDEIKIKIKTAIIIILAILLVGSVIFLIQVIKASPGAGTCSGGTKACTSLSQPECNYWTCDGNCYWDWEIGLCMGGNYDCSGFDEDESTCGLCGCSWIPAGPQNVYLNIGDSWKTVSGAYINIGDAWKTADAVYINIGDAWKTVYP